MKRRGGPPQKKREWLDGVSLPYGLRCHTQRKAARLMAANSAEMRLNVCETVGGPRLFFHLLARSPRKPSSLSVDIEAVDFGGGKPGSAVGGDTGRIDCRPSLN